MQDIERVGILVRVSTTMQVEAESPEHHLIQGESYANTRGWKVAEVYRLDGISGRDVWEHPEMRRMIADVQCGHINGLIVSSLSRLGRKKRVLWDIAEIFQKYHAALIFLDMNLDTSTASGEFMFSILSSVVEWELNTISERTAASVPARAKLGKSTGGPPVFGYRWEDSRLVVDQTEAPIRVLMYQLYAELKNLTHVANELNSRGYRSRRGNAWNDVSIKNILLDPTAMGRRQVNKRYSIHRKKFYDTKLKPEADWIWVETPAIVSEELWEQCQQIHSDRFNHRVHRHLFSGILRCGKCDGPMDTDLRPKRPDTHRYRCRVCRGSIRINVLERLFSEYLHLYLESPDRHSGRIGEALRNHEHLLKQIQSALAKAQAELKRLDRDYMSGEINARQYGNLQQGAETRLTELNTEAARITGTMDALRVERNSASHVALQLQDRLLNWEKLSLAQRREFICQVVKRLEYGDGELMIEVRLKFDVD